MDSLKFTFLRFLYVPFLFFFLFFLCSQEKNVNNLQSKDTCSCNKKKKFIRIILHRWKCCSRKNRAIRLIVVRQSVLFFEVTQLAMGLRTLPPTICGEQGKNRSKNDFDCLYNKVARHRESEERPLLPPAWDNKAIAGDYRNSRFTPSCPEHGFPRTWTLGNWNTPFCSFHVPIRRLFQREWNNSDEYRNLIP